MFGVIAKRPVPYRLVCLISGNKATNGDGSKPHAGDRFGSKIAYGRGHAGALGLTDGPAKGPETGVTLAGKVLPEVTSFVALIPDFAKSRCLPNSASSFW